MRTLALCLALACARTAAAAPDDLVARPLVLGAGDFEARLVIEGNMQLRYWLRPLTFAPDAWVGVTDRLTVGVIHSDASLDRIDAGSTFCLRESDISTCKQLYRGSGLDAKVSVLAGGPVLVAAHVRALLRETDPLKPAVTVGALARWHRGRFAIETDPFVRIGLYNQERGNRTNVSVPLWLALQPARAWRAWFHTGYDGDAAVWRDGWHMPVGFGAETVLGNHIEASLEGGWQSLLGPQHDYRRIAIIVMIGYRS